MKNPLRLFVIQLLTIPLVIAVFKLPGERANLSLLANGIFWFIGILTLSYKGKLRLLPSLMGLQFIITSVLPVTILRYQSWGEDFNTSALIGITGSQWHSYSNISFTLMICGTIAAFLLQKWRPSK